MDKITDRFLTGLFRVANYVASMCSPKKDEPASTQETAPPSAFLRRIMWKANFFQNKLLKKFGKMFFYC